MTEKLRVVCTAHGRIGWPDIVQYEPMAGPEKGELLPCPPRNWATIWGEVWREIGKEKGWPCPDDPNRSCGWPYVTRVHDLEKYEELCATGWISNPLHSGRSGVTEDYRQAPGT
ncbi:MAG: hypothetical protein ACR2RE_29210 [Geminicoccaceae bacterium]